MKKFFSGFLVLCLSLALLTACGKNGQTGKTVAAGGLTFAKSYSEVYSALTDAQKAIADRDKSLNMTDGASDDPESGGKGDGEGEGTFYSGTNVQVAGVDEGDIVKTDGTYIYILRGSELILLDEPTSNVDSINEGIILKSLARQKNKKSIILVSHRESTMAIADRIYKVENGRMAEVK